jgi:hypothetical protein
MPFTFAAGFLEGYITRYSKEMPTYLSISIILITLTAISFYYLIYPYIIHSKTKKYVSALQ